MLKDTTYGSGEWGGFVLQEDGTRKPYFHGVNKEGAPIGTSYLYFVDDTPDAQVFETYMAEHPGSTDIWLGAHTHLSLNREKPEDYIAHKWGTTFINNAALTRTHSPLIVAPSSRLLTFTEGSDEVTVQYYLHTRDFWYPGWYEPAATIIKLGKSFSLTGPGLGSTN